MKKLALTVLKVIAGLFLFLVVAAFFVDEKKIDNKAQEIKQETKKMVAKKGMETRKRGVLDAREYTRRVNKLLSRYDINERLAVSSKKENAYIITAGSNIGMLLSIDDKDRMTGFVLMAKPATNNRKNIDTIFVMVMSIVALQSDNTNREYNGQVKNALGLEGDFSDLLGGKKFEFLMSGKPNAEYSITSTFDKTIGFMVTADKVEEGANR